VSDENVRIVQRIYDTLEAPDESVWALWDPKVDFDVSRDVWGPLVGGGRYRGTEGVRRWMLDLYSAWEHMELDCEELIDAGDHVVSVLRVHGWGRLSGIEVEYRPAGIWTLRDGRVVRVVWFATRDDAMAGVGHA
jgi:ketosteroid isomerase-like protein